MNDFLNHPKCECHQCTWLRANQFERQYIPPPVITDRREDCSAPCCQPGYVGDCYCTHGRAAIS